MTATTQSRRLSHGFDSAGIADLVPLLTCPSCADAGGDLAVRRDGLHCSRCKSDFPVLEVGDSQIPWMFARPDDARLEWRARFNGFLHANSADDTRLKKALKFASQSQAAQGRIRDLMRAREAQRGQVSELLAPLRLGRPRTDSPLSGSSLLSGELPRRQGLLSYYNNIFRDWSWDNGENEILLDTVRRVCKFSRRFKPNKLLTLGAGAGRLSYDLHRRYSPDISVASDLNPLLVCLASRVIAGETVPFYEFPIAPLQATCSAVLRNCAAPAPIKMGASGNFYCVLADALASPYKAGSFDTVLTPWLIDIVANDAADCVRVVNRTLQEGGTWINTGPLAFSHRNEAWCYSDDELLELVAANGFELLVHERRTVPYLQSPVSAHGRIESVLSFSARKTADIAAPKPTAYLPPWLLDSQESVPDHDEFVVSSAHHLLHAQVLASIDGRRSIDDIAFLIAQHYGLQIGEAKRAIERILVELYDGPLTDKTDIFKTLE